MNQPTLRFSVSGPERVKPGEAVSLEFTLSNDGAEPVLVNGRFVVDEGDGLDGHFEVSFDVTGPDGEPLSFLADVDGFEPGPEDFVVVAPHGHHTASARLDHFFRFSAPGAYRLSATYRNTLPVERSGLRAFVGTLTAPPVELSVSP